MKKLLLLFAFFLAPLSALAQNAITLPIAANAIADLGNGPTKVRMIAGNASIFTSLGSGTGSTSGSSTALTLTTTPATPPIVGGLISGNGIASGTTVAAYNGTTGITLSAAMTVPSSTTVSWGSACPSSPPGNVIQASAMADYYIMYTQARVCAVSPGGLVNTLLIEPIFYDSASVVQVIGPIIPGDLTVFNSPTTVKDSGTALVPFGTNYVIYASAAGSDANDCLTVGTACTLQGACVFRQRGFVSNAAVTINVADGTYSTVDGRGDLCSIIGDGGAGSTTLTFVVGNCGSPGNVIFSIPAGDTGVYLKDYGNAEVECVSFTGAGGSNEIGIGAAQFAIVDIIQTIWNSFGAGSFLVNTGQSASVDIDGVAAMTLNAAPGGNGAILVAGSGVNISAGAGATIAIPSALAWGGEFIFGAGNVTYNLGPLSFTGGGVGGTTGKRAALAGPGYLQTGGVGINTFLPGSVAATLTGGFQDDAGDNPTSPVPSGGVSCTVNTPAHITVVNGVITLCN